MQILRLENITKIYNQKEESLKIIEDSSFSINENELVSFIGPSGCGKTTFLQICGLLDEPTFGKIYFNNKDISKYTDKEKTEIRKKNIGFIFQFHHLFQEFSVIENVILPGLINKGNKKILMEKAENILTNLSLKDKIKNYPSQLSGGEKQRVAIARAIINNPSIILADEPTGNLDPENSELVFDLLLKVVKEYKSSLLMVTHNMNLAKRFNKIITIKDKKIIEVNN